MMLIMEEINHTDGQLYIYMYLNFFSYQISFEKFNKLLKPFTSEFSTTLFYLILLRMVLLITAKNMIVIIAILQSWSIYLF